MNLRENVQDFLQTAIGELGEQDAAAMFGFLASAMKSNPGKLAKMAAVFKDPKTLQEIQSLASTKSKIALMGKIGTLYKKFS